MQSPLVTRLDWQVDQLCARLQWLTREKPDDTFDTWLRVVDEKLDQVKACLIAQSDSS